jgi:hypothetical protein
VSDIPQNAPTPTETIPTPTPSPTPDPAPTPTPEPEGEAPQTLVNEPEVPAFDPDKLTLPEGFEKDERFGQFSEWAKEAGINQPQAEKLMGLYTDAVKQISEQTTKVWNETNEAWVNEVKADSELGGANLANVKQTISKLLDNSELTDPKFREALNFTGAGNNPAVIRTLYRVAKRLTEGASVQGSPPARAANGALADQRPQTFGDALYGPEGPHSGGPKLG